MPFGQRYALVVAGYSSLHRHRYVRPTASSGFDRPVHKQAKQLTIAHDRAPRLKENAANMLSPAADGFGGKSITNRRLDDFLAQALDVI
jgi:hypothetical protein